MKAEVKMKVLVMNCSPVRNGATAEIVNIVTARLEKKHDVKNICIDYYDIKFCKGCRTCHNTAKCILPSASYILLHYLSSFTHFNCYLRSQRKTL